MAISAGADDGDLPKARVVDTNLVRVPVQTVAPSYPRIARRDRVEGVVTVCFEIDRKGRPRRVAVRSSTARVFEKPSVKAVKASSFRAIEKGIPVPQIKSCRTFVYSLEPSSGGPS
jgi:TonB family protein